MKFPWDNRLDLKGTKTEMLEQLKELADKNCSRCHGRGYIHWKENEIKEANGKISIHKTYAVCHKCVNKK